MRSPSQPFTGNHAIVNFIDCDRNMKNLNADKVRSMIEMVCAKYSLQVLGGYYHDFSDDGAFTGVCVLAESHISVHSWPELQYVTVDVFLCNYAKDNSSIVPKIVEEMKNIFKPGRVNSKLVRR